MTVVDREARNCLNCTQINLLPLRRVGIVGPGTDRGGEGADGGDPILGQQSRAESGEGEPTGWRPPQAAGGEGAGVEGGICRQFGRTPPSPWPVIRGRLEQPPP